MVISYTIKMGSGQVVKSSWAFETVNLKELKQHLRDRYFSCELIEAYYLDEDLKKHYIEV